MPVLLGVLMLFKTLLLERLLTIEDGAILDIQRCAILRQLLSRWVLSDVRDRNVPWNARLTLKRIETRLTVQQRFRIVVHKDENPIRSYIRFMQMS